MRDLLLEIGLEEVPAKFMPPALAELKQLAETALIEQRISFDEVVTYGTPRRIALVVKNIAEKQADLEEEAKGPAVKAAYDADGNPTKAAMGFARGQGVEVADLYQKEVNGGMYVFATKKAVGVATEEVLPTLLPQLVTGIHFPKPMRWGFTELRYARPIRWIVALYGDAVVPFTIEDIASGNVSRGHRYLGTDHLVIPSAAEYLATMEQDYVIADQTRREAMIVEQMNALAASVEGTVDIDADLLEEVVYLVEYPTALMGEFNPAYMLMPEELIITPMKEHQRYFPVKKGHHIMAKFITVRNGNAEHLNLVQAGNEKVLEARLAD
ncbi:MAG: glycine--tRNA ligase subunit beta, partial [Peptococcaceae bacterium]|nr:glycine--tRNA ligase subunit beta [Peptococcaceae bacterium]